MYHNPQAVVQVNGKRLEAFMIKRLVRQGCPLSPLLYVLTVEASLAVRGIPFACLLSAKLSAHTDDITVFVSCRLDIMAVKKAVVRYKQIAGANINFDKRCLEGWRSPARAFPLEWWTHPHPRDVVRAWSPTGPKLVGVTGQGRCSVGYLASKAVVLKGQGGGVHLVHLLLDPLLLVCTSA